MNNMYIRVTIEDARLTKAYLESVRLSFHDKSGIDRLIETIKASIDVEVKEDV